MTTLAKLEEQQSEGDTYNGYAVACEVAEMKQRRAKAMLLRDALRKERQRMYAKLYAKRMSRKEWARTHCMQCRVESANTFCASCVSVSRKFSPPKKCPHCAHWCKKNAMECPECTWIM